MAGLQSVCRDACVCFSLSACVPGSLSLRQDGITLAARWCLHVLAGRQQSCLLCREGVLARPVGRLFFFSSFSLGGGMAKPATVECCWKTGR